MLIASVIVSSHSAYESKGCCSGNKELGSVFFSHPADRHDCQMCVSMLAAFQTYPTKGGALPTPSSSYSQPSLPLC